MTRGKYLGAVEVEYEREPVQVYAAMRGDFRDTLNDAERVVETIEHEHVRYGDVPHVSITWEYGTKRQLNRGDGSGGCDIDRDLLAMLSPQAHRIHELAERWHLNTMRAGCAHQTIRYGTKRYGRKVPSLDATEPCPVTGYKYGHAWLVEVPPAEVLDELRTLFGFNEERTYDTFGQPLAEVGEDA